MFKVGDKVQINNPNITGDGVYEIVGIDSKNLLLAKGLGYPYFIATIADVISYKKILNFPEE